MNGGGGDNSSGEADFTAVLVTEVVIIHGITSLDVSLCDLLSPVNLCKGCLAFPITVKGRCEGLKASRRRSAKAKKLPSQHTTRHFG